MHVDAYSFIAWPDKHDSYSLYMLGIVSLQLHTDETPNSVRVATAGATQIQNLEIMVKRSQNVGVAKHFRRASRH